jgi:hypothetical protein
MSGVPSEAATEPLASSSVWANAAALMCRQRLMWLRRSPGWAPLYAQFSCGHVKRRTRLCCGPYTTTASDRGGWCTDLLTLSLV